MKRFIVLAAGLSILCVTPAHAQYFGSFRPLGGNGEAGFHLAGGQIGFGDNTLGATSRAVISFGNRKMDLGLQAGVARTSYSAGGYGGSSSISLTNLGLGADLGLDLAHPSATNPNLHLGGSLRGRFSRSSGSVSSSFLGETVSSSGSAATSFALEGIPMISYASPATSSGQQFYALAGLGFGLAHYSGEGGSASGSYGILTLGAGYQMSPKLGVAFEFNNQLETGGSSGIMLGVTLGSASTRG